LENTPLPRANPLIYRSYEVIAEKLSHSLADESRLSESVTQCLWAQTPPLKRGEIAKKLSMSERSLTRKLHGEGTNYSELLTRVQSERATNFLSNRSLSVAEVAYRLGYSEPAAFSRAFNKWHAMSPLQWRHSFTNKSLLQDI
ncbi:MAG: AraC-like DNA-binding protein, partial [Oceanicoccus sp.]